MPSLPRNWKEKMSKNQRPQQKEPRRLTDCTGVIGQEANKGRFDTQLLLPCFRYKGIVDSWEEEVDA